MAPQAIFLFSFITILLSSEIHAVKITFTNNCPFTVWPGAQSAPGPEPSSTGFELAKGAKYVLDAPLPWSGRVWGRTGCSTDASGKFTCATGDCASGSVECKGADFIPPATLVVFSLTDKGGEDSYIISLIDGYNLPVTVTPLGGSGGCSNTSCPHDVNKVCPPELAVTGADGAVIACQSACEALKEDQYCCKGAFSTSCPPTKYSKIFKGQCPQAYSYLYDYDKGCLFTCSGGPQYAVTFCP